MDLNNTQSYQQSRSKYSTYHFPWLPYF